MTYQRFKELPEGVVIFYSQGRIDSKVSPVKTRNRDDRGRVLVALEGEGNRMRVLPRTLHEAKEDAGNFPA